MTDKKYIAGMFEQNESNGLIDIAIPQTSPKESLHFIVDSLDDVNTFEIGVYIKEIDGTQTFVHISTMHKYGGLVWPPPKRADLQKVFEENCKIIVWESNS